MIVRILVLFCVIALDLGISNGELSLKRVFVTYRSQNHTACDFPGGPKITNKSESESRLTEQGKTDAYNFGQQLNKSYLKRLNLTKFTQANFYSMATRTPRTQQSALIVAAGLMGNASGKTLNWTEAEGNKTIFNKTDQYVKFFNQTLCPKFFQAVSTELTGFLQKMRDHYKIIEEVGANYSDTISAQDTPSVWLAYETFLSQQSEGDLPVWINATVMSSFKNFSEHFIFAAETNETAKKLSGGVMVDSLLTAIKNSKIEENSKNEENSEKVKSEEGKNAEQKKKREMPLLAVPQVVLAAMIGAFSPNGTIYNGSAFNAENFYPQDGAHHIIEYYEDDDENKTQKVKVLYSPGGGKSALPLIYPDCTNNKDDDEEKVSENDDDEDDDEESVQETAKETGEQNAENDAKKNDEGMCTFEELESALENVRLRMNDQDKECKSDYGNDDDDEGSTPKGTSERSQNDAGDK